MDWSGVDYCDVFYQTLILTALNHCRASIDETLLQKHVSTNLMKKQTHPNLRWTEDEHFLIFGWTLIGFMIHKPIYFCNLS